MSEMPGVPEDFDVIEKLRAADEAASVAHDFIHGMNGVTWEQASFAIWTIHNNLRPLFEEPTETKEHT
jgi:predicted CoA-binding protein